MYKIKKKKFKYAQCSKIYFVITSFRNIRLHNKENNNKKIK